MTHSNWGEQTLLRISQQRAWQQIQQKANRSQTPIFVILDLTTKVIEIFHSSRQNYGTRKIKVELKKQGYVVSRRRIGRIMNEQGLVSSYTVAQFKHHKTTCNDQRFIMS
ncbi:transposase [Brevibacillus laterosporus]|uniref:Transposase n=1 Tax=Brevibacillus laterosporus TaxID=1465 RepID=A0A518VAG6_BRELA|nr:transposase [Brevibacillus laterosporus]